jgi:hypothetical protein
MRKNPRTKPTPLGRYTTPTTIGERWYLGGMRRAVVESTVAKTANITPPRNSDGSIAL